MLSDSPCRPTIAVSDKEMARAFYGDTLGLPLHEENPVGATFRCGGGTFLEVLPVAVCRERQEHIGGI